MRRRRSARRRGVFSISMRPEILPRLFPFFFHSFFFSFCIMIPVSALGYMKRWRWVFSRGIQDFLCFFYLSIMPCDGEKGGR